MFTSELMCWFQSSLVFVSTRGQRPLPFLVSNCSFRQSSSAVEPRHPVIALGRYPSKYSDSLWIFIILSSATASPHVCNHIDFLPGQVKECYIIKPTQKKGSR